MSYKPVMLMVLDGWGISEKKEGNAIAKAHKPCFDRIIEKYPHGSLEASGEAVGLPAGQMGNSEVGHLNIGAGRIVYQELTRINKAIEDRELGKNPVLSSAMNAALRERKALHLLGLLSDGGVHSHINHLFALLEMAKDMGLQNVFVHAVLDGRDVPPKNAGEYLQALEDKLKELGIGKIATVTGRYYAMDRDNRWERVEKAYRAMACGESHLSSRASAALERAYQSGQNDEFVEPVVIVDETGQPVGRINRGDTVIMYNFRSDRARQITRAFTDPDFSAFKRPGGFLELNYICLTQYDIDIQAPVAFLPQDLHNTLGEVVAQAGLRQLRIAETEKYAHVTFFFNGGVEKPNPQEDRILIPSPKVATYDLQPEMSAFKVAEKVVEKVREKEYDLIVLNYANSDMVGHTGILDAATKAVEAVDCCMEKVLVAVLQEGGVALVTADHGNAEQMLEFDTNRPMTAHTANKVPVVLVGNDVGAWCLKDGTLRDIAPTILELMGLEKPEEMTGESLLIT